MTSDSNTREALWVSLRRRVWIVLLCPLVAGITAFGVSAAQTKEYSASCALLFEHHPSVDQRLFALAVFQNVDPSRAAAKYVELNSLEPVAERTAKRIDPKLTAAEIISKVSVESPGRSGVVWITATDPDPELAARLANTFAQRYIEFRRHDDRKKIDVFLAVPPRAPSSPKIALNTVAGVMLGLILGTGLAWLGERLDKRRRGSDELPAVSAVRSLARVKQGDRLTEDGLQQDALPSVTAEQIRRLESDFARARELWKACADEHARISTGRSSPWRRRQTDKREHSAAELAAATAAYSEAWRRLEDARESAGVSNKRAPVAKVGGRDQIPASRASSAKTGVNLNHADVKQLREAGMTRSQARRVLRHRDEHGRFVTLDELDDLPGFPAAHLQRLKIELTL